MRISRSILISLSLMLAVSCAHKQEAFIDKLMAAPKDAGFQMDGYWIWGSSVIKGNDGKYHMFADFWESDLGFETWVTNTEIAHAVSDTPEGPYIFSDMALTRREPSYFDGCSVFNPSVLEYEGMYYLYYVGTTYDFPVP